MPAESIASTREACVPKPWPLTQAAQSAPNPQAGVAALPQAGIHPGTLGFLPVLGVTVPIFQREAASGPQARPPVSM